MTRTRTITIPPLVLAWAASTALAVAAMGQGLNDRCTVSVLNRNAQVSADGTWILPIVPANFGPVRARATCVEDGVTRSGESALFSVPPNGSVDVPPITLGSSTPIPSVMTLTTTSPLLRTTGETAQITVIATFPDGSIRNVTSGSTGTLYTVSNPAIASISADGLVTGLTSGTALVQATHEGASGIIAIMVVLSADSDGDGILDDIELREGLNPNNPADAFEDFDLDGLSNLDEVGNGTQLRNADSDADGILDGEEVLAGTDGFVTSPLLADTDGDGVRDLLEIQTGSDPTNAASLNLAGALSRLDIAPPGFTLTVNTLQPEAFTQLTVTGQLRDGFSIDLTSTTRGTNYSSSNLNICNFGAPDGRVYAGSQGTCTITATNNGFSAATLGVVRNFSPLPLAFLHIPGFANNVDVSDNVAYIAAGSSGLTVVDVSNPGLPVIVATLDTSGNANDVRVVGRFAYVADGTAGLKIIDVVDPAAPVLVGAVATPGDANDVAVLDDYVYVAAGNSGLVIVNASNPAAPAVAGQYDSPGYARGVDVVETLALIAEDSPSAALRVVNVANPAAPSLIGSVALAGNPKDVRARDNVAFVPAYTGGLHVVDFSNPAAPQRLGGLPGSSPAGFIPQDFEMVDRFGMAAEVLFVNGVPIVDLQNPAAPVLRAIVNFAQFGDQNGTGIAIDGPYFYMTGDFSITDNGVNGNSGLFIGQYLPLEDLAGIPPQVEIVSPADGTQQYEGLTIPIQVNATDDVAVSVVSFAVNGQVVFFDTAAPWEYVLQVPTGVNSLLLTATAIDTAGNNSSDSVTVTVVPDPLTTVSGLVVDVDGAPLVGATVTTAGDRTGTTGAGGAFSISGVPSVRGDIVANATYVSPDGTTLSGSSAPTTPVPAGITNVGTITAIAAQFETNYGTLLPRCDDCAFSTALPFPFPYFGTTYSTVFIGTNGYLTFVTGDGTFGESVGGFNNRPRIAPFFDDLDPRGGAGQFVNATLPGKFVVTWDRVPHFPAGFGGPNTIQVILFSDGRIQFGYRGITSINTGIIVGINPRASAPLQQINYSTQTNFSLAANTGLYEYFLFSSNLFDLDNAFVLFTPGAEGGYGVRTTLPPPPSSTLALTGGPASSGSALGSVVAQDTSAQADGALGNAEVEVLSSGDVSYRGLTNTNGLGNFSISGVPPGGITVTVRKKNKVLGVGSLVARGRSDNTHVHIHPPKREKKDSGSTD